MDQERFDTHYCRTEINSTGGTVLAPIFKLNTMSAGARSRSRRQSASAPLTGRPSSLQPPRAWRPDRLPADEGPPQHARGRIPPRREGSEPLVAPVLALYSVQPWSFAGTGVGRHEGDWEFVQLGCTDRKGDKPVPRRPSTAEAEAEFWRCETEGGAR
jgi:hypothetical protein